MPSTPALHPHPAVSPDRQTRRARAGLVMLVALPALLSVLAWVLGLSGVFTPIAHDAERPAAVGPATVKATITISAPAPVDAAATGAASPEATYRQAVRLFRGGRFAAAYGRFAQLADAGHRPSARMALLMHDQGAQQFGSAWDAWPHQRAAWARLAAASAPAASIASTAAPQRPWAAPPTDRPWQQD